MKMENGMTMVELLITIVVVTILLALGVPSFQEFIKNNRVTAQTNAFVTAIQLARSEAVKRGANTVLCASTGPDIWDCSTDVTKWTDGWIVFSEADFGGTACVDAIGDPLDPLNVQCRIREAESLAGDNTLISSATSSSAAASKIRFSPVGQSLNGQTKFTLTCPDCRKDPDRHICILNTGHPTIRHDKCPWES